MLLTKHISRYNVRQKILLVLIPLLLISTLSQFPSSPDHTLLYLPQHLTVQSPTAHHNSLQPHAPQFCKHLIDNPRPYKHDDPLCTSHPENITQSNQCLRFFSQYQQDIWFWLAAARHMPTGVYVDVGANRPAFISNSFFLDRCLGWKGVCVEGQTKYHDGLRKERTCSLASCVSSKVETVSFVQADDLGGIEDSNKNVNGSFDWQQKADTAKRTQVQCVPLKDVLRKEGISHVTFLSIDVEGAEMKVLNGIDWDHTDIWFISVEGSSQGAAGTFLQNLGYTAIDYSPGAGDKFYVSPKVKAQYDEKAGEGYLEGIMIPDL